MVSLSNHAHVTNIAARTKQQHRMGTSSGGPIRLRTGFPYVLGLLITCALSSAISFCAMRRCSLFSNSCTSLSR